jgi:dolichyl-diphosphooligosaccharide---protein glycosyltransferase
MVKESEKTEEISLEKQAIKDRRGWIENQGEKIAPAFKILILAIICFIAVGARVFSVIRYESIIHEFDPWFNFRGSEILEKHGWYSFKYWIDQESWYPLGRYSGHTLFPGLMFTAWTLHGLVNRFLLFPVSIKDVCVFTAPIFSAFTAIATYALTKEITKKSESGFFAALFMAIIPSYLSRSVAGSYDNEAVAIFALVFSFYTFVRAVNRGTMMSGLLGALAFYYMVLTWGGYVFVLGVISLYVIGLIVTDNFNSKVYVAYSIFYIIGNLLSLTMPFVAHWAVWESSEHLPSHIAFILMNLYMLSQFIKANLSKEKYDFLTKAVIRVSIVLVIIAFLYIIVMGKTTTGHRILTLINPVYAKKHNPLVASISEHQPTSWSSFWFDL